MARKKKTDEVVRATYTEGAAGVNNVPHTGIDSMDKERASYLLSDEIKVELFDLQKLPNAVKNEIVLSSREDIKNLVREYYQAQSSRIKKGAEIRSAIKNAEERGEPTPNMGATQYLYNQFAGLENEIKKALDVWTKHDTVASWCREVMGIGPVIAAGLVTYFDITRAPSASHFLSYAGLNDNNDPWLGKKRSEELVKRHCKNATVTEEELMALSMDPECPRSIEKLIKYAFDEKKGVYKRENLINNLAKIPYNAELKTLLWKLGESFVKVSKRDGSKYGEIYRIKSAKEAKMNAEGLFADQAATKLEKFNIGKTTDAYKAYSNGQLPKAHLHARAIRYTEKIFVCHLFEEMYRVYYNSEAPRPYPHAYLDHVDIIPPEVPYTPLDPNRPSKYPTNPVKYY